MADEKTESGLITPCTAGDLKKNQYGMLKGHPCKITEIRTSKTGKHGHAKCSITGVCVLTGKKFMDVQPSHASMYQPDVTKREYQLMMVDGDEVSLMDDAGADIRYPLEGPIADELRAAYEEGGEDDIIVTVLTAPMMETEDAEPKKVEMISSFKKQKATV